MGGRRRTTGAATSPPSTCRAAARVDRRVPKKLLTRAWRAHGRRQAPYQRRHRAGVLGCGAQAHHHGVAEYRDEVREYLEIAVLRLAAAGRGQARPTGRAGAPRGAVSGSRWSPSRASDLRLSLAHKRWSQGEAGKTVLDGEVVAVDPASASDRTARVPGGAVAWPPAARYALCALSGLDRYPARASGGEGDGSFAIPAPPSAGPPGARRCGNTRGSTPRSRACAPRPRRKSRWRGRWN